MPAPRSEHNPGTRVPAARRFRHMGRKREMHDFDALMARIRACRLCQAQLPLGCRPVLQASPRARLLIVSQAPGRKVHETGIPFNDPSGERLRDWLGIDRPAFYDAARVAIVPMGFCFPGTGGNGDLPPRPECAPTWHPQLLPRLEQLRLTLAIGQYAQAGLLGDRRGRTLTDRKSTRLNSSHIAVSRMPSSA